MSYMIAGGVVLVAVIFLSGVSIVRPTLRGLVERLAKYRRFAKRGFNWVIPVVDRTFRASVTEVTVNADPAEIITSDKMNARVDAQVYFKVKERRTRRT